MPSLLIGYGSNSTPSSRFTGIQCSEISIFKMSFRMLEKTLSPRGFVPSTLAKAVNGILFFAGMRYYSQL